MLWIVCLVSGVLLEAFNSWIYARKDRSGWPLIPPIAIAVGAFTAPGWPMVARVLIAVAAGVFHFALPFLIRPERWARLRQK